LHSFNRGSCIGDGAKRDADDDRLRHSYSHTTALDCRHADRCPKSESDHDRHGDRRSQPGPDLDGDSESEHGADCNRESKSDAEPYADAGAHADENSDAHVHAHKSADRASADAKFHQIALMSSAYRV
jgi:hypothetical protein